MKQKKISITRRELIKNSATLSLALLLPFPRLAKANDNSSILYKTIPSTGEKIPAIGMGTWITFNVGENTQARNERLRVLETFFKMGGGMIDSSPMYGSAESAVGDLVNQLNQQNINIDGLFSATKVWTPFSNNGAEQVTNSHQLWKTAQFDLLQVHNLVSWQEHLEMLKEHKNNGKVRYIGISTSHGRRHNDIERIIQTEEIDFIQLTYNILDREAERRLLPIAKERKIAVIANRPFQRKQLFSRFDSYPLPTWASEIDCNNWAQFFLKFIISHPAITCAIPATSQVVHMAENMGAMSGRLPDTSTRKKMTDYIQTL